MSETLLSVRDLRLNFNTYAGIVEALEGVTFDVKPGETVGLVGETGCGKSVTALSIIGLIPVPGKIVGGEIFFKGEDLLKKTPGQMRRLRGKKISMIFQDPMTYLNPVLTIGDQVSEVLQIHEDASELVDEWKVSTTRVATQSGVQSDNSPASPATQKAAILDPATQSQLKARSKPSKKDLKNALRWKTVEMLKLVRMPEPSKVYNEYPHELSGGMRQRAIIAMMLSTRPELLLADEPTTALDVTVQAQILKILRELKAELGLSMVMITHDLGIVAENCDRVNIMYAGRVVESGPTLKIFGNPQHPYTQGLLRSIPRLESSSETLAIIPGTIPSLIHPPSGCRFHTRCPFAMTVCREKKPKSMPTEEGHTVACFLYHEGYEN